MDARMRPGIREKPSEERASIAEQAKALLEGKNTWKNGKKDIWEDDGEAVEVEKELKV